MDAFENGLVQLEKNFVPTKHKVGVLNVLAAQKSEKEIYANRTFSSSIPFIFSFLHA
jgi:hypothetical protein